MATLLESSSPFLFDVVIPVHYKDLETLDHCIEGIRKNVIGFRKIFVLSKESYTNKAEWYDEAKFPFTYQEVSDLVSRQNVGWNFQQLLKLYSPLVIPGILPNVLVVDADTVFLRKVKFFDEGLPLYNLGKDLNLDKSQFHQISSQHIKKILPEIEQKLPEIFADNQKNGAKNFIAKLNFISQKDRKKAAGLESGICHHMLFQKSIIQDLFTRVEVASNIPEPFYKIFLKSATSAYGVTEYNLYFYFLTSFYPKNYKIRLLSYKNTADFDVLKERLRRKYHYCSYHSYMKKGKRSFVTTLLEKLSRLFLLEQWNIGIIDAPIHEILQDKIPKISWLKNSSITTFYADPFGFVHNEKSYIISENYSKTFRRGRIAIGQIMPDMTMKANIVLDDKMHLSYPYITSHEGKIYTICESSKLEKLELYELDADKLELRKIKSIFSNQKVVDASMLFHQNKFWIFYTTSNGPNYELCLAYSDSLFGEFKQHKKNPVKLDKFSARSAGEIFTFNNEIYRPTQNCLQTYGGSVVINRITELSEENFSEEFVKEINPDPTSPYNSGIHNISSLGNKTLIDGKRTVYVLYRPLVTLLYFLRKILLVN